MNSRSFLYAALIAGVVIAFLGNLPVLNLINCILCIWVWLGGILAVFLYRRFQHGALDLTGGQAAGLGALAGLIGALIGVLVFAVTSFISMPLFNSLAQSFDIQGDMPFQSGGIWSLVASAIFFLIVDAILYPLFGALGAYIAVALMKKPAQASS